MAVAHASLERPSAEAYPEVGFSPRRLGHSNNFVGDVERSMRFFVDVCGFEEVARELQIPAGFVSNGNTHHDLGLVGLSRGEARIGRGGHVQMPKGRGIEPGLNHMGWEMENQKELIEGWHRFEKTGLPVHRLVDHQTSHSVYLFDPDGILHEIYADAIKDWRTILQGDLMHLTGSWDPDAVGEPTTDVRYHPEFDLRVVPEAALHPIKIARETVICEDYDGMVDFYDKVIGLEVKHRGEDFTVVGGAASDYYDVALFRPVDGEARGMHHMSFTMPDEKELEEGAGRLAARGVAIEREVDNELKRSIFISDPDGMGCEFYVDRNPGAFDVVESAAPEDRPYLI